MSEGLRKLLEPEKVAVQEGNLEPSTSTSLILERELSLADLSKKLAKRDLANVCVLLQWSISRWERESRCPSADFLIRFGILVKWTPRKSVDVTYSK